MEEVTLGENVNLGRLQAPNCTEQQQEQGQLQSPSGINNNKKGPFARQLSQRVKCKLDCVGYETRTMASSSLQ